jgi:hypothetical protein
MTNAEFREMCRAACYELRIDEPDALFDGHDVFIDGVKLGVFHDEDLDGGIHCYVDMGAVPPPPDSASVLHEVLAINLELDAALGESIGVERDSGHLVLRAHLPIPTNLDERVLVSGLKGYAALVNELYSNVLSGLARPIPGR